MGAPILRGTNGYTAIFLHIPYTGGRSIIEALGMEQEHVTARTARFRWSFECNYGALFSVVRHPLDHALSYFCQTHSWPTVEAFRLWIQEGYRETRIKLSPRTTVNPFNQWEFLDAGVTIFRYPDLQAAVDWASQRCGKVRRLVQWTGRSREHRDWERWYDDESRALVRRERTDEFASWFQGR